MIMTFNELKITDPILKAIGEKGYLAPTPIQQKGIPVALDGRDMLGIAQTGTGKTAAFAIPILQHLSSGMQAEPTDVPRRNRRGRNHGREYGVRPIRALILTPTRELAVQIGDSFSDYGKYVGLKHLTIFGGVKQGPQVEALRGGVDILIATPGRLHDLIGQRFVELDAITHFVLDEADRMLDMGFVADIKRLLPLLPKSRQTLFFSATMPADIVALSKSMLTDPVRVEVTPVASAVDAIDQRVYFVEKPEKKKLLVSLLREEDKSVLVFSRTKHGADNISRLLSKSGIRSEAIHGNKSPARTHGFQVRQDPGDGRYGHRCPWHRHPGTGDRHQLRSAGCAGNVRTPYRPHRSCRTFRNRPYVLHPGRAAAYERHTAADGQKTQCGNIPCIIIFKLNLMAKSQTFGKRENEKKKQAKRLEKQKRREERQAGGSSSLDDMIAYVDENGNITDTPPQLRPKVEIQLEDIVIATPKKEDIAAEPLKGRVEYFNTEKGYGFIKDLASTEKYFFHISSAPEGIGEGRIVLFELMRGTRGMNAVKIAFAQ